MPNTKDQQLQIPLQDKYVRIFQDNGRPVTQSDSDELWLAQPFAQEVVKSTTSSSSSELPDTLLAD